MYGTLVGEHRETDHPIRNLAVDPARGIGHAGFDESDG